MENEQSQVDISPEEAKAALGLSTRLSEQFMIPQAPEEGSIEGQEAQGGEQQMQPQEEPGMKLEELESRIMQELQTLREEVKAQSDSSKELSELKKKIEEVLNEE